MRGEIGALLKIAIPLVVAEIGWSAMGAVDTMMVGRLPNGAIAIGSVSLAGTVFYTVAISFSCLLLGLDTLLSQAHGAGKTEECDRVFWNGMWLAAAIIPVVIVLLWFLTSRLPDLGARPEIVPDGVAYLRAVKWSAIPLVLYFSLRRYLQATGSPQVITFALVSANLVNAGGNWMLMWGHCGFPAMGVVGSAWGTVLARTYMCAVLAMAVAWRARERPAFWAAAALPEARVWSRLLRLGGPAGGHVALEIAVFSAATALIARLAPVSLAAHQVVLNVASLTFMVPLGISAAAAVRVGHEIGGSRPHRAAQAGWTALAFAAAFMSAMAVGFATMPYWIARAFTNDRSVIEASLALFTVAALFQLFDGIQIVSAGALRGAGDTRSPMFANLGFYWFVGMPLGYVLAFRMGFGAAGVWAGLCVALMLIGVTLLLVWNRKAKVLRKMAASAAAGRGPG